ncbi:hypothetical protein ACTD5D_23340 [Nocardia takedensis]|uniref:hypothetical protein n=1 Tax=Nocardia takedensis TaxID=259390 RepID=UPI003F7711F1
MAKSGIEYEPDAVDPRRVRLHEGLPEGVARARITFRAAGGIRRSRIVRASEAEFAQLEEGFSVYAGVLSDPERIAVSDARLYIARAEEQIAQARAELEQRIAQIDTDCGWCRRPRTYLGILTFHVGTSMQPSLLTQHAYRCDSCGSTIYFEQGYLPHPLN